MGEIADLYNYGYEGENEGDRVTCRRCGEQDLEWQETPKGWRLAKDGVLHVCDHSNRFEKEV